MWAQLIKMRSKPDKDTAELNKQLRQRQTNSEKEGRDG
jgi:hypothetical protein